MCFHSTDQRKKIFFRDCLGFKEYTKKDCACNNMIKNKKTLLLTGLTGFIGRHTARKICQTYDISAIIRPSSEKSKYAEFENDIKIVKIDLSDREKLSAYLDSHSFDFILHIGALRGGRKFNKNEYSRANVIATELLLKNAIKNKSKFIFCSSVGVYGTIPKVLPADLYTPYQEDNVYHKTKIQCEKIINKAVYEKKLDACIIRPAITYGINDFGFPYTLTKLVAKRLLYLPQKPIFIQLLNVDTLSEVFAKLLEKGFTSGKIWNVADKNEICFQKLADFIYDRLMKHADVKGKKNMPKFSDLNAIPERLNEGAVSRHYPTKKFIKMRNFELFLKIAKLFKNELWISRLELISNSWYFDVSAIYEDLGIKSYNTIPDFGVVVDWYVNQKNNTQ